MVRGIWNLHINEKWYRLYHPRGRISPPEDESTFQMIKQLCDQPDSHLGKWELVAFPSPLHSSLDYVYTVDQDTGVFIISLWQESLRPAAIRIDLARLCESSRLLIKHCLEQPEYMTDGNTCQTSPTLDESLPLGSLDIDLGFTTSMNELQERFFTDLVFVWRFYIDDPLTWRYGSPVFRVLSIAFLRLAAWDFELSRDPNVELPISFNSIPSWNYPNADVYWFHGCLVVLQEDVESKAMINKAIKTAKPYIGDYHGHRGIRLILISLQHVTFLELSHDVILASKSMALLTNHSAIKCSPGFRALIRILTSDCWKTPLVDKERWKFNIPPEILHSILHELEPRDAVAFSQASFTANQCYYASVPQFKNTVILSFNLSIPCCGKRTGLEEDGVCCLSCYSWRHIECIGAENWPSDKHYICMDCQKDTDFTALHPGGINIASRREIREGCRIRVGESEKSLHLRLSKPSHLRPELRLMGNLVTIPPRLVDYTILFNRSFSGLAYGLEVPDE